MEIRYKGELAEEFIADVENKVLSAESVEIAGPKSVVDQITTARIDVDLSDRTESIGEAYAYTLCNQKGEAVDAKLITTNVENIMVSIRIARMKEVKLTVPIIEGGGATKKTTEILISPETIRVSGSESQLAAIEELELGNIDLSTLTKDSVLTFPIKLPEGVENETGVTEATVTVRFKDLATKTLKVSNFNLVNVPKGLSAKMITQALEVKMRGTKSQVDKLKTSNVTAVIDFTDTKTGTEKINAQITSSVSGVGAVGTYTVSATVKENG